MRNRIVFKDYRKAVIFFILTAVIILIFLPRKGKFKYEFQKGKPWNHENLVAPFDFPIYKSASDLLEEQKYINENYSVYYEYDSLVGKLQTGLLSDVLFEKKEWHNIDNQVLSLFNRVYSRGIVGDSDNKLNTNKTISIIKGNISEDYPLSDLFTIVSAFEYIKSSLRNSLDQNELNRLLNNIDFKSYLYPNLIYNERLTQQVKENRLESISPTQGMVLKDDKIISKGEIVSANTFKILTSLKKEYENNVGFSGNFILLALGQFLFVLACLGGMFILLLLFRREMLAISKNLIFLLVLINLISIVALLIINQNESLIYFVPFTIVPIYIATFFYSRPALFVHWMIILMIGNFVPNGFEFVFLNSIAGIVSIWGFKHLYKRGQLFLAVLSIFIAYNLSYFTLKLIQEGSFTSIHWSFILGFIINSLLIITLYQFTFVFEKLFGFLSDSRLIELSDTNQKLLRELAEVAPGTFQHSLQVANLAEAAIREIGGNALLVRTGALYHDIGKMKNPIYFIENQTQGYNPHSSLLPEESAKFIIEHVTYGVELAHKYNLPEAIIDFIRSHHATSKVYYFYSEYKEQHPDVTDKEIAPLFTYPGFCPRTKETAVVMISDATEAASRSLKQYSIESISTLVDKIVNYQLNEGYFNNADITMNELSIVKDVIKRKLQNIYHNRIEYPEMKSSNEQSASN